MKLLEAVHKKFKPASTTKARNLIKDGFVLVSGIRVTRPNTEITSQDSLELVERHVRRQQKAPFEILFEDSSILVVIKPAGIVVEEFFKKICAYTPAILTHRLDREVSGIMIFAKSVEVERILEDNWSENDKLYIALIEGKLAKSEGRIESWLAENKKLKVYSTHEGQQNSKRAVTHYKKLSENRIEIRLETGRKNQIRVHLSELGCPIVGDLKYGAQTYMRGRIALHAYQLSFNHPLSGERMTFTNEVPF